MIKIKLSIDPTNKNVVSAFNNLMNAMGSNETLSEAKYSFSGEQIEKTAKITKTKETFKDPVKETKDLTDSKSVERQEKTEQTGKSESKEEKDASVSISDIRLILGQKVTDHRETIKAELNRLDAKNVSVLDEKHYEDFKKFLDNL